MSKFLQEYLGTGSGVYSGAYSDIGEEEATQMLVEATEDYAQAEALYDEVDRLHVVVEGLESLAVVAGKIEKADVTQLAMLELSTEMALAGSGVPVEHVVPGLENFKGRTISNEVISKIKDTAKKIWNAIKSFVIKILNKIKAWFNKYFGAMVRLQKSLEKMRKRAEGCTTKTTEETEVNIGSDGITLRVGITETKSFSTLKTQLVKHKDLIEMLYGGEYTTKIKDAIDETAKMEKSDIGQKGGSYATATDTVNVEISKKVNAAFNLFSNQSLIETTSVESKCFGNDDSRSNVGENLKINGVQVFSNMMVATTVPSVEPGADHKYDNKSGTVLTKIVQGYRIQMMRYKTDDKDPDSDIEFEIGSPTDIMDICDIGVDICSVVNSYSSGKKPADLDKSMDKLIKAMDKLTAKVDKIKDKDNALLSNHRQFIRHTDCLTKLSSEPLVGILGNTTAALRAFLSVSSKCLSTYK